MTPTDIAKLRELAKAAEPGPWKFRSGTYEDHWELISEANDDMVWIVQDDSGVEPPNWFGPYLEAANPSAVLELIAQNEELEAKLEVAKKSLREHFENYEAGYGGGG